MQQNAAKQARAGWSASNRLDGLIKEVEALQNSMEENNKHVNQGFSKLKTWKTSVDRDTATKSEMDMKTELKGDKTKVDTKMDTMKIELKGDINYMDTKINNMQSDINNMNNMNSNINTEQQPETPASHN